MRTLPTAEHIAGKIWTAENNGVKINVRTVASSDGAKYTIDIINNPHGKKDSNGKALRQEIKFK